MPGKYSPFQLAVGEGEVIRVKTKKRCLCYIREFSYLDIFVVGSEFLRDGADEKRVLSTGLLTIWSSNGDL